MIRRLLSSLAVAVLAGTLVPSAIKSPKQISVATAPPATAKVQTYRDSHFGVRFQIPPGWTLTSKDHQVTTFRLDARSAVSHSQMRAVASMDFNPLPLSTLSGATFYYSVEPHTTEGECARQATPEKHSPTGLQTRSTETENDRQPPNPLDIQSIGGMTFVHGHDEHGNICIEARDDIYTAFRKGSCYRFDLTVNTFCSVSSGATDITPAQLNNVEQRMTSILSTVTLDWQKPTLLPVQASAPHPSAK